MESLIDDFKKAKESFPYFIKHNMNHELRAYWKAAEAGELEVAAVHRAAFDAAHPVASNLFSVTLGLLVVAVLSSPAALAEGS